MRIAASGGEDASGSPPTPVLIHLRNLLRVLAGSRMTDAQDPWSLPLESEAGLRAARTTGLLAGDARLGERLPTVGDVAVLEILCGADVVGLLKLARTPAGEATLGTQLEVLDRLRADPRLEAWWPLLPRVVASGRAGSHLYAVEEAIPGVTTSRLVGTARGSRALREATVTIGRLHRATGTAMEATPDRIDGWLEPALSLLTAAPMLRTQTHQVELIAALRRRIGLGLQGRSFWCSRTHGDYSPDNILYSGASGVTGVVDWAQSKEQDLALVDPVTLLLASRSLVGRLPLGRVVAGLCRGAPMTPAEAAMLREHRRLCPTEPAPVVPVVLLAWLRHVETNLLKSPRYGNNPFWMRQNVEAVLTAVAAEADRRRSAS